MEKKLIFDTSRSYIWGRLTLLCCLFLTFFACVQDDVIVSKGLLNLQMNVDTTLTSTLSTKATSISELKGFEDADSYKVVISQDSGVVAEYARFDKMPEELELKPGKYSLEVSKGTKSTAAFNSPYFSGKQDFTIVEEMTTPVEVTASLANSRVTVEFSDDFIETYKDYTLSFKTNKMSLPLVYEKGESRPMYFESDAAGTKLTIGMELVNVYGKDVQFNATTTIKPKQWSKLTIRTDEKGLNGVAIDVVLNDETKETVYVNIGIPDFMEQLKGAPNVTCETFQWTGNEVQETPFDLGLKDVGNVLDEPTMISVLAGGKIAEMKLSLSQDNKTVFNYDLANLSDEQQAALKNEYKLDVNSADIKGKLQYSFDIQPLLNSLKGTTLESEYLVTLSVKDALPNPNTTVRSLKGTLNKVGAPSITTDLSKISFEEESYIDGEVSVAFSAPAGIKSLLLSIPELSVSEDITAGSSISNIEYVSGSNQILFKPEWFNSLKYGTYVVTIDIEDLYGQTASKSFNIEVNAPVFEWAMAENEGDVFAKYAFLRVKAKDASKVKFYQNGEEIISDLESLGRNEETGVVSFVWKGLDPGAKYDKITAKYDGERELGVMSFTTENVESIPNGDFEKWNVSMKYVGGSIKKAYTPFFEAEGWGTNNDQTAIDLSGLGGSLPSVNTSYRSFPAVTFDNYQVSVRSIGYGGYSSSASSQYSTSGKLWLYDDEEGMAIESRPTNVSILYKMDLKEDKFGKVEIYILGQGGEVISSTEVEMKAQADFGELSIPLDYKDYKKASRMKMKFYSSTSESPSLEDTSVTVPTPDGNKSYGVRAGNVLTIQKVELIYDYE